MIQCEGMGKKILVILILLLTVRPIVLAENLACGEETAVPDPIPTKAVPCSDNVQAVEVVSTSHHCPCPAFLQPNITGFLKGSNFFSLFTAALVSPETAVASPLTPPPRLV